MKERSISLHNLQSSGEEAVATRVNVYCCKKKRVVFIIIESLDCFIPGSCGNYSARYGIIGVVPLTLPGSKGTSINCSIPGPWHVGELSGYPLRYRWLAPSYDQDNQPHHCHTDTYLVTIQSRWSAISLAANLFVFAYRPIPENKSLDLE